MVELLVSILRGEHARRNKLSVPGVMLNEQVRRQGAPTMNHAILAEGLAKRFGETKALDGIDLAVRPGTVLAKGARAGSFVEIKNSRIGEGSKVPHLAYVGDATVGKDVNIGAGTITCNYDGVRKHRTVIGDGAFIGSDTMLVAPLRVGKGAVTGAGSTITRDVPAGALAVERSEQRTVRGYRERSRRRG
jgi:tetrahydrodipicolinate N-succinyltransferase